MSVSQKEANQKIDAMVTDASDLKKIFNALLPRIQSQDDTDDLVKHMAHHVSNWKGVTPNKPAIEALFYKKGECPDRKGAYDPEYAGKFTRCSLDKVVQAGRPIDPESGEDYKFYGYYNQLTETIL